VPTIAEKQALDTYDRFVALRDEVDEGKKSWSALAGLTGSGWSTPRNWTMCDGARIVSQWDQVMGRKDDGTPRLVAGLSILYYAGNGLFCYSHDMLNMVHVMEELTAMKWTPSAEFNMPPRKPPCIDPSGKLASNTSPCPLNQ